MAITGAVSIVFAITERGTDTRSCHLGHFADAAALVSGVVLRVLAETAGPDDRELADAVLRTLGAATVSDLRALRAAEDMPSERLAPLVTEAALVGVPWPGAPATAPPGTWAWGPACSPHPWPCDPFRWVPAGSVHMRQALRAELSGYGDRLADQDPVYPPVVGAVRMAAEGAGLRISPAAATALTARLPGPVPAEW